MCVLVSDFYEEFGDEEGGKRKIMSALQRESAYKEKVARFGLDHHHNDNVVDVHTSVPGQVRLYYMSAHEFSV